MNEILSAGPWLHPAISRCDKKELFTIWMSSNFGQIGQPATQLSALERLKIIPYTYTSNVENGDSIFLG